MRLRLLALAVLLALVGCHSAQRDPRTVVFLIESSPANLDPRAGRQGRIGVAPGGMGGDFWRHPIGTGPFRFVSQQIDQDVVLERNPKSWSETPKIERVRFAVVPDAITQALALEKRSADLAVNSLPMDALPVLARRPDLEIADSPETQIQYLAFNVRDPLLQDASVRQAIALSIDRKLIIAALLPAPARPTLSF